MIVFLVEQVVQQKQVHVFVLFPIAHMTFKSRCSGLKSYLLTLKRDLDRLRTLFVGGRVSLDW
jgi:hypothetical protein